MGWASRPARNINKLADLRGKKIAYSPGQAQGALVLRILQKAGLRKQDVTLVELPSTGDVYPNAIASRLVDAAPIGRAAALRYLRNYRRDGAKVIEHGLRDDPLFLYAPVSVLQESREGGRGSVSISKRGRARYVGYITIPDAWIAGYYVKQARPFVGRRPQPCRKRRKRRRAGELERRDCAPATDDRSARQGKPAGPGSTRRDLFDRRFENVAAHAIAAK